MSFFEGVFNQDKNGKGEEVMNDQKEQIKKKSSLVDHELFRMVLFSQETPKEIVSCEKIKLDVFLESQEATEEEKKLLAEKMAALEKMAIKMTESIEKMLDDNFESGEYLEAHSIIEKEFRSLRSDLRSFCYKRRL